MCTLSTMFKPWNWKMFATTRAIYRLMAWNLLSSVIFAALGTFSTAYGLAIPGSTFGQPNFYTYFDLDQQGQPGFSRTAVYLAILNGVNAGGAVFGCLFTAVFADKKGRKLTILMGGAILTFGGALNAGSLSMTQFVVGRTIAGIGSGILAAVVPIYQGEIAPPEIRGAMMGTTGVMYACGYTAAGFLGFGCWHISATSPYADAAWRGPLAFQCVTPLIVCVAGAWLIPESPRWLLSQGKQKQALENFIRLRALKDDRNHIRVKAEFCVLEQQYEADRGLSRRGGLEIFKGEANRRRLAITALTMFGSQFLGVYVIAGYGPVIYGKLGLKGNLPLLLNACWSTLCIPGNLLSAAIVDRVGRTTLLVFGSIACLACLVLECALTVQYLDSDNQRGRIAAVSFLWVYVLFWSSCVDGTQFTYVSEIWPNHLRAQGTSWALGWFFTGSVITSVALPIAMEDIQGQAYNILIVPSFGYIICIVLMFPETRGLSLEDISTLFDDTQKTGKTFWHSIRGTTTKETSNDEGLSETDTEESAHKPSEDSVEMTEYESIRSELHDDYVVVDPSSRR